MNAYTVETMLLRLGYRVTSSTSSIEALGLFRKEPNGFDPIMTDYAMPYITGIAKKLLAIRPDVLSSSAPVFPKTFRRRR